MKETDRAKAGVFLSQVKRGLWDKKVEMLALYLQTENIGSKRHIRR